MNNFIIRLLQIITIVAGVVALNYTLSNNPSPLYLALGIASLGTCVLLLLFEDTLHRLRTPAWLRTAFGLSLVLASIGSAHRIQAADSFLAILGWAVLLLAGLWVGFHHIGHADLERRHKNNHP